MMRSEKKCYLLLCVLCLLFCWLFVLRYGVFGAVTDWVNQHSVFPDYFRKRFYATGNLFPDFAWNLGGGQNIYHLSYYGLYNPVFLFAYLLPFLRMDYYIMGSSILCYVAAVLLFFRFLRGRQFSIGICMGTALLFALASSFLYHSYNQLMFVNYMPFLCLSLIGTDRYLAANKRGMLLAGVMGMLLTSFYFSIGGMAVLCIYALSEYLEAEGKVSPKEVVAKGAGYVGNLLLGILLAGFLLVPTAYSILTGRREASGETELSLLPSFVPLKILYSPYGMGLSVLVIAAVLAGLFCASRWQECVRPLLLTLFLVIPAVGCLLNGGLYDRGKAFIPFIPLLCLQCAKYVSAFASKEKMHFLRALIPWVLTALLLYSVHGEAGLDDYMPFLWMDFCVGIICFLITFYFCRKKVKEFPLLLVAACLCLFCFDWEMHPLRAKMIPYEAYQEITDRGKEEEIRKVLLEDEDFYRLERLGDGTENHNYMNRIADSRQCITSLYSSCYNEAYRSFRKDTFMLDESLRNFLMQPVTSNPCFLQLMGVRYLLTEQEVAGYQKKDNSGLLYGPMAAPVFYVTDAVISEKEYDTKSFPDNQTILLERAVVPESEEVRMRGEKDVLPQMETCSFELPECATEDITIVKDGSGYEITAEKETEVSVMLEGAVSADIFGLTFHVDNQKPKKDMYIRINGQTNRLTSVTHEYANQNYEFTYMVTLHAKDTITVQFGEGSYHIGKIHAYIGRLEELQNPELYQSPVAVDTEEALDDSLTGQITTDRDGYLITSIPYDENLRILLDGETIDSIRVNTAFLGARIPAGEHTMEVYYNAPGKKAGFLLSLLGLGIIGFHAAVFCLQNICGKI